MIAALAPTEEQTLKICLVECKRRLDGYRKDKDDIQAALCEADMNQMLDELGRLNK